MGAASALIPAIACGALLCACFVVASAARADDTLQGSGAGLTTLAQATPKPPEAQALPKLPPRVAVGGVRLLETTSTLLFTGAEAVPITLTATFAFPERARFYLGTRDPATGGSALRELRYQYGSSVLALNAKETGSKELAAEERIEVLRDFELRRALFLWPDSAAWKAEGRTRTAPAGELGTLRARCAEGHTEPDELELVLRDGSVAVAARAVTWVKEHGRTWPSAFEGWRMGKLMWHEEVESHDTARVYVDSFFLPADRRDPSNERDRMLGQVLEQTLPRFVARRIELARGLNWTAGRVEIARLQKEWVERLRPAAIELDSNWTVEVGEALEPRALWIRLVKEPEKLPEGFVVVPQRSGRVVFLEAIETASAERLGDLRRALPPGAKAATPYVRIPAAQGPMLLVLPIDPRD